MRMYVCMYMHKINLQQLGACIQKHCKGFTKQEAVDPVAQWNAGVLCNALTYIKTFL